MRRDAAAIALAGLLLGVEGCFTAAVYDAWEDSVSSSTLELRARRSRGSTSEILWRESSVVGLRSSGSVPLDSKLEGCEALRVVASDGGEPRALDGVESVAFAGAPAGTEQHVDVWSPPGASEDAACTVRLFVEGPSSGRPFHTLHASTRERALGAAMIPAERDPRWPALFPAAVAADAVTFPVSLAVALCALPAPENPCLGWLDEKY